MSLQTLKQKLVATIDASEDAALLQDMLDILSDSSLSESEVYYRSRLEKSIEQADAGQVISSESVHKMARQWLTK